MKKIVMLTALLCSAQLMWAQEALLWKVTGKDATKPSYLFASHVVCMKTVTLPAAVEAALGACKKVYFELPDTGSDTAFERLIHLPPTDSLERYFSAEEYSILSTFIARRLQLNMKGFQHLTPAFMFNSLRNMITYCRDNTNYTVLVENLAFSHGQPSGALELPTDAVTAQLSVPPATYVRLIMDIVYESERIQRQRMEQMEWYKKQDIQSMYNAHLQHKELGGYEQLLLADRNRRWVPVLKAAITLEESFICVGALHLPGENGLISLLRKEGFTVTAVR